MCVRFSCSGYSRLHPHTRTGAAKLKAEGNIIYEDMAFVHKAVVATSCLGMATVFRNIHAFFGIREHPISDLGRVWWR